jgi:putative lipoprotein
MGLGSLHHGEGFRRLPWFPLDQPKGKTMRIMTSVLALSVILAGCKQRSSDSPDAEPAPMPAGMAGSITERDWTLVSLGDNTSPMGAGGKPVTLRLDTTGTRAEGFAGCNRYTGSYTLSSEKLEFGPAAATKMACDQGTDVETAYLAVLPKVASYQMNGSTLELRDAGGTVLARFQAQ